jgi:hypothetical protein
LKPIPIVIGLILLSISIASFALGNAGSGITIGWALIAFGLVLVLIGMFHKPIKKAVNALKEE